MPRAHQPNLKPNQPPSLGPSLTVGAKVRWYETKLASHNGWRFGTLLNIGRKWGKVRCVGQTKKILIKELRGYVP